MLTLGTVLYLTGHSMDSIFQLLGGLSVIAAALAWAANTGQRLLPAAGSGALGYVGPLA